MEKSKALKYLYRVISFNDYLEAELIKKLSNKKVDESIIEELIENFKQYGYINDKEYVENFVYFSIKKLNGPYKIKNKLLFKGASIDLIEEEIEKQYPISKQLENIKKLIRKTNKEDNKLVSFCVRRGYSLDLVLQIINEND